MELRAVIEDKFIYIDGVQVHVEEFPDGYENIKAIQSIDGKTYVLKENGDGYFDDNFDVSEIQTAHQNKLDQIAANKAAAEQARQDYLNSVQYLADHLANYREQKITEGITVDGLTLGGDDKTMLRVAGARIKANADPTFTTKWNGVTVLDAAAIIAMSEALLAHVDRCFDAYGAVDLTGLTTPEQVEAAFDTAYNQA